jgi:hypothetical protein
MKLTDPWQVKGIYFEACSCDSVCPCYSAHPPTYGYCEGNCAWHITEGKYGDVTLDGLNVIMALRCDGFMRETPWLCWFFIDDQTSDAQFEALKRIFTLQDGGYLAKTFGRLWQTQGVERAQIEMKLDGWQHRTSVLGKLGLAIGVLKTEAGPTLCRLPNVPGVAALADEDWFDGSGIKFDYKNKNALSSTFAYQSDQ